MAARPILMKRNHTYHVTLPPNSVPDVTPGASLPGQGFHGPFRTVEGNYIEWWNGHIVIRDALKNPVMLCPPGSTIHIGPGRITNDDRTLCMQTIADIQLLMAGANRFGKRKEALEKIAAALDEFEEQYERIHGRPVSPE